MQRRCMFAGGLRIVFRAGARMELRRVESQDDYWQGRGWQHFHFSASEDELHAWLPQALPTEYAPYALLLLDVRWGGRRPDARAHVSVHPVDALPRCLEVMVDTRGSHRASLFLGSTVLTPDLRRPPAGLGETSPLVAGLLELGGFSATEREGRQERSLRRLTYCREANSGEVVQHEGYKALLRALRLELGRRSRAASKAAAPRKARGARRAAPTR